MAGHDPVVIGRRLALLSGFSAFGGFWGAWGADLPGLQRQCGLSDGGLGLVLLAVAVGALAAMRVLSRGLDRLGEQAVTVMLLAMAVAACLPGLSHSGGMLAVTLLLVGAVSGVLDVALNAACSEHEHRSGVSTLPAGHGCFSFGLLAGAVAGGLARQAGLPPEAVLALPAAVLVGSALLAAHLRLPAAGPDAPAVPEPPAVSEPRPARTAAVAMVGLLAGLSFLVEDALQNWSSVHVEHTFHARPAVSGLAPAVFGLAAGVSRLVLPRWSGTRSSASLVRVGGLAGAAGCLLAGLAPDAAMALVGLGVAGAGLGICAPLLFAVAGASAGSDGRARAVARVTTVAYVGFVVGPPLTGGVAGLLGLRAAFVVLGGVALLLAILASDRALPGQRQGSERAAPAVL